MPKAKIRTALRPRKRWAESVEVPRWLTAAGVLAIGLLLLLARLSDPSGRVVAPGSGSILYLAALLGLVALVMRVNRKRGSARKREHQPNRRWSVFRAGPYRLP